MLTLTIIGCGLLAAAVGTAVYMGARNARKQTTIYAMEVMTIRNGKVNFGDELQFKTPDELSKYLDAEIEKAAGLPSNPGNYNSLRNIYLVEGPVTVLKEIRAKCTNNIEFNKYVEKPPVNTHIYTIK